MSQTSTISPKKVSHQNQEKITNNHLFCYEIDSKYIFIESGIKMEVLERSIIYPVPNAPKWYLGVTSLRGDILTVVNMHFLLHATQHNQSKRLLKLEHPDFSPIVLAIDHLPHQRSTDKLQINPMPNKKQYPDWITSSSTHNEHTFLFADHAILFNAMQNNSTTTQSSGGN
jgi:chemotaxis signal transduction protein